MPFGNLFLYLSLHANKGRSLAAQLARRSPPPIFSSTAFPVQLVYNSNGSTPAARYSSNYATASFKHTGTVRYVDAALGNDTTGTGSSGAPYATIMAAHNAATAGDQIYVRPGIYYESVITTKNITIIVDPANPGDVIVGDLLKPSDIASISALSSGVQTVTLNSGFIHGFVDRTRTYEAELGGAWLVAQYSIDTAKINARQALNPPRAGLTIGYTGTDYTGAAAIMGTADARAILASDFGPNILAWKKGALAPLKVGNATTCYTSGIKWIGGKERVVGQASGSATTLLVDENTWMLGQGSDNGLVEGGGDLNPENTDQVLKVFGRHIGVGSIYVGSSIAYQDVVDYDSTVLGSGVHINCFIGQGGNRNGDQGSTIHGGVGILALGNTYFDCSQDVGDLGPTINLHANAKHKSGMQSLGLMYGAFVGGTSPAEHYLADIQRLNTAVGTTQISPTTPAHTFDLDGSTASLTHGGTGTFHQWGGTTDPTADTYLARIVANKTYLYQTADTSQPVTASGQSVGRIQDAIDPAVYYTLPVGTATYTEGAVNSITFNNAALQTFGRVEPYGVVDIFTAMKGSGIDGSGTSGSVDIIGATNTSSTYYGDIETSAAVPYSCLWSGVTPVFKVDGVAKTSKTAMRQAALDDGLGHVVTCENVDLSLAGIWNGHAIFNQTTNTGTAHTLTGDLYDYAITRHTGNSSAFTTYYNAAKAAAGL